MAKRYGIKPSEFLKEDINDLQFNLLVSEVGFEAEYRAHERALKKAQGRV